ncbi:hypothetical protein K5M33_10065 [Chromobacterium vaccinii]|nr:hypothetical protein [Chromobacterium vaccinii]MBX9357065.1 hypothetical protein [Chromobacterium vaccinii]
MKQLSLAVLALILSAPLMAAPKWDEAAIVKAVGVKPLSKKAELDDGCNVKRYAFQKDPYVELEFKCNRVNVAWAQFPEKGFEKKNQTAIQLATRAAAALSQGSGREIDDALKGNVLRDRSLLSGLTVGGSCSSATCLLTYR